MKAIYFILVCLFFCGSLAVAQSNTDEMLGAPKARNFIQLWSEPDRKTFFYIIDRDKNKKEHKTLNRRLTVGVPQRDGEVAITMRFFNPLRYSVKTTDTMTTDPSWVSVGKFASALTDLIKQLPNAPDVSDTDATKSTTGAKNATGQPASRHKTAAEEERAGSQAILTAGAFDTLAVMDENRAAIRSLLPADARALSVNQDVATSWTNRINEIRSEHLAEWKYLSTQGRASCVDTDSYLLKQLEKLDGHYFNTWYRNKIRLGLIRLSNRESIQELVAENKHFALLLDTLRATTAENKALLKTFDGLISEDIQKALLNKSFDRKTSGDLCVNFASYSQIVFKRFVRVCTDNQTRRDRMLELAEKLNEEINNAVKSADETSYDREGSTKLQNSFIVGRYNILEDRMRDVTVVLRKRALDLETDPPSMNETDERIVGRIRLRVAQTFVPEFSTGIYYTNIQYPVYGTRVLTAEGADALNQPVGSPVPSVSYSAGQTVIDAPTYQKYPIVLAGMLNLTLNALDGLAHPLIQLGVGTGRNRPSLLAGLGIRLKWTTPIVVSAGTIWSWKKELETLKVNDVVTGSNKLESDLIYQLDTRPRLYLGIQVNFK